MTTLGKRWKLSGERKKGLRKALEKRYALGEKFGFQKGHKINLGKKGTCNIGENNGMYGKKGEDNPNYGTTRSPKQKEKMSFLAKKRFANPKNNPMYGKPSPHGKRIYYKGTCMRSTWEINTVKWLDKHKIKWLYEHKRFVLKDRTYCPDFYLPERNIYWEVKGWFWKYAQETIKQFRELYPKENLLVLTEPIYGAMLKEEKEK